MKKVALTDLNVQSFATTIAQNQQNLVKGGLNPSCVPEGCTNNSFGEGVI